MRVLFLTPWYPEESNPHYGVFIRDQAVALAREHEVLVIASKVDYTSFGLCSSQSDSSVYNKVHEHRLRIRKSLPFYNQLNYLLITFRYTWKIVRAFKPDIIHGNIGYPGSIWSWVTSKLTGVPYVITEHSTRFDSNLRSPFHRMLTLYFTRHAAAVISVSEESSKDIYSFVRKQPVIVPNMIVVDQFRNITPRPPGRVCQFGFLGGLETDRKGLDILLKAVAGLKVDFVLHIGGKGKLLEEYKTMARALKVENQCIFYGFVADGKVPEFMGGLHFFVSASRAEGFGMVIAEAMACGLPVVVTRSGGPEDFITPSNGILVPPNDVGKLKDALEWMIDNYSSFDKVGIKAQVGREYSPEIIAGKISEIYVQVVNDSKR